MKQKQLKFCPKCKSTNWTFLVTAHGAPFNKYKCKDCGYIGTFLEIKANKLQRLKNQKP